MRLAPSDIAVVAAGPILFTVLFYFFIDRLMPGILVASSTLALLSLALERGSLARASRASASAVAAGAASALALYALFVAGDALVGAIGLGGQVELIYSLVERSPPVAVALALVAVFEEVYWRGALQEGVIRRAGAPWWYSALAYSASHAASGLLVLVAAALVVGLVLGYTARRWGIISSSIAHYLWLALVFYVAPLA